MPPYALLYHIGVQKGMEGYREDIGHKLEVKKMKFFFLFWKMGPGNMVSAIFYIFLTFETLTIRGGIKKKNWFFSEKLRKGGGGVSPNPKFPYQKKLRFFRIFF